MECDDCGVALFECDGQDVVYAATEPSVNLAARNQFWDIRAMEDLCPDCKEHR